MEWRKLKDLIILILLVVNGFLLVLVWSRRADSDQYERSALTQTIQVLERAGIRVDADALAPADALTLMAVDRDLEREAKLARALLDEQVEVENRGGGLYLYQGTLGQVSIRSGGELSAAFEDGERWRTDRPEQHAAALLGKLGLKGERTTVTQEDGQTVVRFRQIWNGAPVFSCEVSFYYQDGRLTALRGTLIMGSAGAAETSQVLTLPTALLRFSEAVGGTGDVCSEIRAMEPGWRGFAQSLSGGVRLTPVWLVSTDTAEYYLDSVTGAAVRLPGQSFGVAE